MADYRLGMKATGEGYERLRRALESVESANDPGAIQRETRAVGLFQFMPFWQQWVQKETGRPITDFLPKNDSPAEMARAAKEQREVVFPKYYEQQMAPWIAAQRKAGLGRGRSDLELGVMFHKLGAPSAREYLRSGYDASKGTKDNEPIEDYVRAVVSQATNSAARVDAALQVSKWHGTAADYEAALAEKGTRKGMPRPPPAVVATHSAKAAMPMRAAVFSGTPDAALSEAKRCLAGLTDLRMMLGVSLARDEAEQRLLSESRGAG